MFTASLGVSALVLGGCGASHKPVVCPVSSGHTIVTPLTGRLVVLGRPPVEVRIDNRGDLRHGIAVLGTTDYTGWFALKSHFITPPSYQGGFTVRLRQLGGAGLARLGGEPSGTSFSAPAGPAPNEAAGWRDFPGGWTWTRGAGCYEWDISGHGFRESVVVRATALSLGLAQPPSLGVVGGNVTTRGRIGISISLKHPALGSSAELVGRKVRLHQGGLAGRGPTVWQGYVHIDRHRLGLPTWWDGSKPVRYLVLHLTIHYPTGTAEGAVRVQLRPGWG